MDETLASPRATCNRQNSMQHRSTLQHSIRCEYVVWLANELLRRRSHVGPARTLICKGAKAPTGSVCGGGATRSGVQTERKKKEAERKALEWGREDGNYREQGHNDPDSEQALGARAQRAARCRSAVIQH